MLMAVPSPAGAESKEGLDFHAIWNAFRRRWFLALFLGLLFGIPAGIAGWTFAPAPYVSFAEIRLNSIKNGILPGSKESVLPDFNVRKQTVMKRATHPMVLKEALRSPDVLNSSLIREQQPHEVSWLEQNVVVKQEGTEYLRIELEGENPSELTTVVKAVADALVADIDADATADRAKEKKSLETLLTQSSNQLAAKQNHLDRLRSEYPVKPELVDFHRMHLMQQTNDLRRKLDDLEEKQQDFLLQSEFLAESKDPDKTVEEHSQSLLEPQIQSHPDYQAAAKACYDIELQIEEQKRYLAKNIETLSENHPNSEKAKVKVASLEEELKQADADLKSVAESVKRKLQESLKIGDGIAPTTDREAWFDKVIASYTKRYDATKAALEKHQEEILAQQRELDEFSVEVRRLQQELDKEQDEFDRLKEESERLQVEIDNSPVVIEISREAAIPHERSLKKKTMAAGVGGMGIFGLFVVGIVFFEYRTQRIASLQQVSQKLNLRVIGAVPLLPRSVSSGNTTKKKAKNALWYSALTEAIDSTRTLLLRGSQVGPLKTVMVASAIGGEGKTTLASHLATSLARGGRKILIIDCDFRRPCLHQAFGFPMEQGVCEVLRGEADVADCIKELNSPTGLSVLPAGRINQQVLKLLALDSFGELLEPLKAQYDFIIIDSSPLLPVTDGLLVAHHADGVILSIRRDVSRIGKVVMACQKLSMLGIPMLGAVTIGLEDESGYRAKYGYNYSGYGQSQHYYTQPPPV